VETQLSLKNPENSSDVEDYGTTSLKINVELYYVLYTLTPPPPLPFLCR